MRDLLIQKENKRCGRKWRKGSPSEWVHSLLKEKKKLLKIIDPRLDGDYPIKAVHKAARLAYHCLNSDPKARPRMREIVHSLEPLQAHTEAPIGKKR